MKEGWFACPDSRLKEKPFTTDTHEQRGRTVYNLFLWGAPGPAPWDLCLSSFLLLWFKKKNGTAKATEERTDPSQLPVHRKVGKSESDEAAAHSTATAGIREQWTHLAAWLPFLHVYGPNSLMRSRWSSHGCILGWSPKPSAKLRTKINHPFITWESVRKGRYQILPFALFPEFT